MATEEDFFTACSNADLATVTIAVETNKLDVNCVDVSLFSPILKPNHDNPALSYYLSFSPLFVFDICSG